MKLQFQSCNKNLFFPLLLCISLLLAGNTFSQSLFKIFKANEYHPQELPSDEPDMGTIAIGLGVVGAGALVALLWPSPSAELELSNEEILGQLGNLSQYQKPVKLAIESGNKYGTIKSINRDQLLLNEDSEPNQLRDINSLIDLESAAKIDRNSKTRWSLFVLSAGIGVCIIASSSKSSGVDEVKDAENISQYLLYGAGACVIAASAIMYFSKSEAEEQWEKFNSNGSESDDVSLSVQIGLQKFGALYMNSKIVYTNMQPCITAKLCF